VGLAILGQFALGWWMFDVPKESNSVSVIETRAPKKLADIPVGELPWGVVR